MSLLDYLITNVKFAETGLQQIYQNHALRAPDPAGIEHYALLRCVSEYYQGRTLYEIGTYHGSSSLALSQGHNTVKSWDIVNVRKILNPPSNIEYCLGDFRADPAVLLSPCIFIDVDPHDGIQERQFHEFLLQHRYQGLVIWDDVHLNPAMSQWWHSVQNIRVDLTALGHSTGTGMVYYQ